MPIQFFFAGAKIALSERKRLKAFIKGMLKREKRKLISLSIIFCKDKYLLEINRQYLGHDYYTDIITFNLAEDNEIIEGEIYISVDRIRENALINVVTTNHELHRVIFHGILHLCGYMDKLKSAKDTMTRQENQMLQKYFGHI
jgi:rRNA maturation RNase YbeY